MCRKALADLEHCKKHEDFTDVWYTFLTAVKGIYTSLEQGAKVSPQSRQWYGAKVAERKKDSLLQYVYQARNDDEHGIEPVSEDVPGSLGIGKAAPGLSSAMRLDTGPDEKLHVTSLDGKPVLIEQIHPHVRLITVRGRGRDESYAPPASHLEQPLQDKSPHNVASLALNYLTSLVEEAKELA